MPQGLKHFPLPASIVQFLSLEPGFPPLVQSVISSSLSLSSSSSLSFSLPSLGDLTHSSPVPFITPQDLQSSLKCVYVSISLTPILLAVCLPRSYGSFVSLVISSYGCLCISLRFSCRVLFVRASLQLRSCGRFLSCSFWHYE